MPLSDVIAQFHTGSLNVRRAVTGTHVDGIYQPTSTTTITTDALHTSVQPISGRALRDLPEGQRSEDTRWLWTTTELRTRTPSNDPDIVELEGDDWRVIKIERFRILDDFHRVTITRLRIP